MNYKKLTLAMLLGVGMLISISPGAFAQQSLTLEQLQHPNTQEDGIWMDVETFNWFYGAAEFAMICNERFSEYQKVTETQLIPAYEAEKEARLHAEAAANRRGKILRWALPTSAGLGLLLGITGGILLGN